MVNRRWVVFLISLLPFLIVGALPSYAGERVDLEALSYIVTHDQNTITAGIAEVLDGTSQEIRSVIIKALGTNTGNIYIGGPSVTSSNGYPLDNHEVLILDLDNIQDIYINGDTTGEGIDYFAIR